MKLLPGCPTEAEPAQLRHFLGCSEILDVEGLAGSEDAVLVGRICRSGGCTVRSVIDWLITVMALRREHPVLARDRDFEGIAQHVHPQLISLCS